MTVLQDVHKELQLMRSGGVRMLTCILASCGIAAIGHSGSIFALSVFDADIAARDTATAKSVGFSAVSGTEANRLLEELQLTEVDGFAEAPFETLAGQTLSPQ